MTKEIFISYMRALAESATDRANENLICENVAKYDPKFSELLKNYYNSFNEMHEYAKKRFEK